MKSGNRKKDLAANITGWENRGLRSPVLHVLLCVVLASCGGSRDGSAAPITDPVAWRRGLALAGVDTGVPVAVSGGTRVPCDTAPHGPSRYREVRTGGMRIEVPSTWEVHRIWEQGVLLRVPDLADPRRRASTKVSVITAWSPGPVRAIAPLTDTLQAGLVRGTRGRILVDTVPDADHRYTWLSWNRRGTTYSVFDGYGRTGGPVTVGVLIIVPLLKDRPRAAYEALSHDTGHLLSTLTLDGRRVFPGWALHPVVECYAPAGAAP